MRIAKALAVTTALTATLTLAACGNDDSSKDSSSSSTAASTSATQQAAQLPTAQELSDVLNRAVDPNIPTAEKTDTVVNGEQAPQLFDALTAAKQQSGATLQVVDPVLPALTPGNASATVNITLPNQPPQVISEVEFVNDNGKWKLDQRWACTLVQNVLPDQVPPMCNEV